VELAAFRSRNPGGATGRPSPGSSDCAAHRPADYVQQALVALGESAPDAKAPIDLRGADLAGADLRRLELRGALLQSSMKLDRERLWRISTPTAWWIPARGWGSTTQAGVMSPDRLDSSL
jgi:hypothetical protein